MITAIYGNSLTTQDSIAWWLCNDSNRGPQMFTPGWSKDTQAYDYWHEMLGPIVEEKRWDEDLAEHYEFDADTYDTLNDQHKLAINFKLHINTLRHMSNDRSVKGRMSFLSAYKNLEPFYDMVVWSNYFGTMRDNRSYIGDADKVIIVKQDNLDSTFHYMINHAFKTISRHRIDQDSELWWTDHVYVEGVDTTKWKDVWYDLYHQKCIDAYYAGDLQYMWQLNFMHWDLHNVLDVGDDHTQITMCAHDDYDRLFASRMEDTLIADINKTIGMQKRNDRDNILVVNSHDWFDSPETITEFLGIECTQQMQTDLQTYKTFRNNKYNWFTKTFQEQINRYT